MCGINGALSFNGYRITDEYVTRMREQLVHRGPDGGDTWVSGDGRVGLGFRRLAIVDLSPNAMQPFANEDGSVQLVFNGEIYNHREIRAELEALGGHTWRTDHSDTEVIVHAFEQWGIECVQRFRGMFALAIWDARTSELWLVRDRIGIKPLYYSSHHGRLVFASEIKALLEDPDQERAVDEVAFFHYLSFLTTPGPETLFKGIKKLPGGTWLRVRADGTTQEHRYWEVWDHVSPIEDLSDEEIAERVLDELRTSVQYRKMSDVPVGVFLSGGIDSSTNAALFSEGEDRPVRTFSIGYEGEYDTLPQRVPLRTSDGGADRRRASRTGADPGRPPVVPAEDGAPPGRADRRPGMRPGLLRVQAGARQRRHRRAGGRRSRRALLGLPVVEDLPQPRPLERRAGAAPRQGRRCGARHARAGKGTRREVEFLRRGVARPARVLERRRSVHADARRSGCSRRGCGASLDGLTSWEAIRPLARALGARPLGASRT